MLDGTLLACAHECHAEDVFHMVVENPCGSLAPLVHEATSFVQGNGVSIRCKNFEFEAGEASSMRGVDRFAKKLSPKSPTAEGVEQSHSEYA